MEYSVQPMPWRFPCRNVISGQRLRMRSQSQFLGPLGMDGYGFRSVGDRNFPPIVAIMARAEPRSTYGSRDLLARTTSPYPGAICVPFRGRMAVPGWSRLCRTGCAHSSLLSGWPDGCSAGTIDLMMKPVPEGRVDTPFGGLRRTLQGKGYGFAGALIPWNLQLSTIRCGSELFGAGTCRHSSGGFRPRRSPQLDMAHVRCASIVVAFKRLVVRKGGEGGQRLRNEAGGTCRSRNAPPCRGAWVWPLHWPRPWPRPWPRLLICHAAPPRRRPLAVQSPCVIIVGRFPPPPRQGADIFGAADGGAADGVLEQQSWSNNKAGSAAFRAPRRPASGSAPDGYLAAGSHQRHLRRQSKPLSRPALRPLVDFSRIPTLRGPLLIVAHPMLSRQHGGRS